MDIKKYIEEDHHKIQFPNLLNELKEYEPVPNFFRAQMIYRKCISRGHYRIAEKDFI